LDHYKDSYQTAMAEVCVVVTCMYFVNLAAIIIYDSTDFFFEIWYVCFNSTMPLNDIHVYLLVLVSN